MDCPELLNLNFNGAQDEEKITKNDLIRFQELFNGTFKKFKENILSEMARFKEILEITAGLKDKVDVLTNENKKLKDDMAQVKSELLISEEERRKDKEQIGGISRELKILKKKGNSADYTRINEEQIEPLKRELKQNQETLNELHRRIKEIPEIKMVTEVSCGWEERLRRLVDSKTRNQPIQRNDSPYRNTNEKIKVKENILILGDSNTKKIN